MIKILLLSLALGLPAISTASSCQLPAKTSITIGCSTQCTNSLKNALRASAKRLGYRLNIITMYNSAHNVNFDQVDGILVPGGVDIDPKYYKDKVEPELSERIEQLDHLVDYTKEGTIKDPFEYKLWQTYFSSNHTKQLPALGICRGMQMMAVSQNIPLYIDIREELGIPNRRKLHDTVTVNAGPSKLRSILSWDSFKGYKNHHQGVRVPYFLAHSERWPHLALTAFSHQGQIAEALEGRNHLALGVQFHPEQEQTQLRTKIFNWLLENSCQYKKRKLVQRQF